jgi:hypothetical protein
MPCLPRRERASDFDVCACELTDYYYSAETSSSKLVHFTTLLVCREKPASLTDEYGGKKELMSEYGK